MLDVIPFIKEYSYLAIFVIIFLECSFVFLLPGDSLLFAIGIIASRGHISLVGAILTILIAGVLGGNFGYFIGRYFERVMEHKHFKKFFPKDKVQKAHDFFEKNGNKTILLARFVPIVRTFAPLVAGFSEMKFQTFWKYNVIGGVIWAVLIPTLGFELGHRFPTIEHNLTYISVAIVLVSVLPLTVKYYKELQKKEREKAKNKSL